MVDEYGALQGLVTLEDILDEIFGEIPDETCGKNRADVRAASPTAPINIDGIVPVRDLNRELDWNLPDEEATTIAGLVIHEARTIPDVGQRFAFFGFKFEILRRQRNQITALRVYAADASTASTTGKCMINSFQRFGRRQRGQRQRVDPRLHFVRERGIDAALALDARQAFERLRNNAHVEMRFAARPCAGMAACRALSSSTSSATGRERSR